MASLLRVVPNSILDYEQQQRDIVAQARFEQETPFVIGISDYIRKCFDAAKWDRTALDDRMLKSLRQRLGQYDPEMKRVLDEQGGNQVYMLLTQTKCRGAEAWMRDVLLSTGMVPWDMAPTPMPEISAEDAQTILADVRSQVEEVTRSGVELTPGDVEELEELAMRKIKIMRTDEAKQACVGMKKLVSDQLYQGNFMPSIDAFLSDLCTYQFAVIKGPIITNQKILKWIENRETGEHEPSVSLNLAPWFSRVSPFDFYWEPGVTDIQNGYTIERHELSRRDVVEMKNQPGYNQGAVDLVLEDYSEGLLNDWLDVQYNELERRRLENRRGQVQANMSPAPVFKALEFNGSVSGEMLLEWGREDIEDPGKEYEVNAWLIGRHVVRAVLNVDPLHEKPYRVTTFNPVPNSIAGLSLPELIADTQAVCNASARAIVNNMAIASGPQVEVNIDRLPPGEKIKQVFPWKIWQTLNDPLGSSSPAVRFEQPSDNSQSLMQIFEKFSRQADEQSGIPAYTYGDTDIQGAGRTASGLSMLMGSAGKGIRQIITGIDTKVVQPALRHIYRWNMLFSDDMSIKGDADVIMKGTSSLVKEQVNLRRNEFLQTTANEFDMEVVGMKGRAAILREVAEGLEMDVDKIIPSEQEIEIQEKLSKQNKAALEKAEIDKAGGNAEVQMQKQKADMEQKNQQNQQAQQQQQMQQKMDEQKAQGEDERNRLKLEMEERIARAKLDAQVKFDRAKLKMQQETEIKKASITAAGVIEAAKINAKAQAKSSESKEVATTKKESPLVSTIKETASPLELSPDAKKGINDMMSALLETAQALRKNAGQSDSMVEIQKLLKEQIKSSDKPKKVKVIRGPNGRIVRLEQEK